MARMVEVEVEVLEALITGEGCWCYAHGVSSGRWDGHKTHCAWGKVQALVDEAKTRE